MNKQQPEALRLANILRGIDARSLFANEKLSAASAALENQHARITELESQLAQRFDAADLPEALRVPLDSLHADAGYLCGRLLNGSLTQEQVVESIRRRIDAAKLAAITAQAISAEPAEHVQNPAENEHVAGDVSGNGAGLNMSTQHARITELESQLAQRFDAADVATASAQGFRDGMASVSAGSEPAAIRPDIQAVLAMLDVPVIARMSSHEGRLLKPGQEPPAFESAVPLVREWDHRRACESIIAALSRNN